MECLVTYSGTDNAFKKQIDNLNENLNIFLNNDNKVISDSKKRKNIMLILHQLEDMAETYPESWWTEKAKSIILKKEYFIHQREISICYEMLERAVYFKTPELDHQYLVLLSDTIKRLSQDPTRFIPVKLSTIKKKSLFEQILKSSHLETVAVCATTSLYTMGAILALVCMVPVVESSLASSIAFLLIANIVSITFSLVILRLVDKKIPSSIKLSERTETEVPKTSEKDCKIRKSEVKTPLSEINDPIFPKNTVNSSNKINFFDASSTSKQRFFTNVGNDVGITTNNAKKDDSQDSELDKFKVF